MSTYNWNAADYERHSQAQQKWARELIEKLSLQGTEDVLDVGCGDGKISAEIADLLPHGSLVGVDNSTSMITLATERHPSKMHPNLTFKVMDASDLSFEDSFGVVFSNAVLHWVKDHKPMLDGLFKSLKFDGRILLQMGGKGNAEAILVVLQEICSQPEWQPFFKDFEFPYRFFGIEEYKPILLESGFEINRVELIPKDMEHAGKSGLEAWIRTTWLPYTERIPEETRDKFIDAISTKYIEKETMDKEDIVHVEMVRIEIEARKARGKNKKNGFDEYETRQFDL